MKSKGPLASFEDTLSHLVQMSEAFTRDGDPRTWPTQTADKDTREWGELAYDEWVSGAWNHIDGVVKPGQ